MATWLTIVQTEPDPDEYRWYFYRCNRCHETFSFDIAAVRHLMASHGLSLREANVQPEKADEITVQYEEFAHGN